MNEIVNSPLFGILLSVTAFEFGVTISKKWKYSFLNPLLIANILIVGFLLASGISLESYNVGGDYISVLLSPATVVLAVPLYKQITKLVKFWKPILAGIIAGSMTSMACVILVSKAIGLSDTMGSVVSEQIGGIPSVTIISIVVTGITGAVSAPAVCRFCRIKHKVAQGIAIGTASHALGTTKAMELGEIQGAMSSLSIGIAGLFTAVIAPIIVPWI